MQETIVKYYCDKCKRLILQAPESWRLPEEIEFRLDGYQSEEIICTGWENIFCSDSCRKSYIDEHVSKGAKALSDGNEVEVIYNGVDYFGIKDEISDKDFLNE